MTLSTRRRFNIDDGAINDAMYPSDTSLTMIVLTVLADKVWHDGRHLRHVVGVV
jgi:hypothetical protein